MESMLPHSVSPSPSFARAQTIVNTWPFVDATAAAWDVVRKGGSAVDAVLEVRDKASGPCARCQYAERA